jgi:protein O-GlcNAc transferase
LQRSGELTKVEDLFRRGSASYQAGNLAEAERLYRKVLRAQPKHLGALNLLGILLTQIGKHEEAERAIRIALEINARSEATQFNHGVVLKKLQRLPEALNAFDKALALNPQVADTWNSRGAVLNELRRFEEALRDFDQALALKRDFADALYNRGNALQGLKRYEAAIESYDQAIKLNPHHFSAYNNRGTAHLLLRRLEDALSDFNQAIVLKPDLAENYVGRGDVFVHLMQLDEAFAAFDQALAINPALAEAWRGRGTVFCELRRFDDALAAYDRALALKNDFFDVWLNRGQVFFELSRYHDALLSYERAGEIRPDLKIATLVLATKMLLCDWGGFDDECARVLAGIRAGDVVSTFAVLSLPSSCEDQLDCARAAVAEEFRSLPQPVTRRARPARHHTRSCSFLYDLRSHAVGFLSVGMFEHHDRSRFETFAISLGPDDASAARKRMEGAFDHFHDVRLRNDQDIAELIRDLEIDIAVDLNGFTQGGRMRILARRPAPIQVNYLGYPGTMGADFIDYIIADRFVIPPDQQQFYAEKVVYLPDTYQANDDKREISDICPSRAQAGLPTDGFVFCCFNNTFKINPPVFDIWMNLLREVEGSVLWLLEGTVQVPANLRMEAGRRGISGDRLIFAPRAKLEDHLARHRLADVFLDTLPYNAHTTASDALWAGLPVVTCAGVTFAGRVAASLLNASGLPGLITNSLDEYEALALRLARNPALLAELKTELVRNRRAFPLFDTARFTRHIESAYEGMWERHQRGESSVGFAVRP